VAAVVLAAGIGSRMKSARPKVLHPLAGRPMIAQVMAVVAALEPARQIAVISPGARDEIAAALPGVTLAVQDPPQGTGHAVMAAREALDGFAGDVLVLFADSPLISVETLEAMLAARNGADDPAVVVMGFRPADTAEYARLIVGPGGHLDRIVEHRDVSADERTIKLCNSGFMAIDGAVLFELLDRIDNDNSQGEYYLTDIVAAARAMGRHCAVVEGAEVEALGINDRAQLAAAEAVLQHRMRHAAMAAGATLRDPDSIFFSYDTMLGRDVTVGPNVVFGPGVVVGEEVTIEAFCHLEGCIVAAGARIGPFARLRPEAEIGFGAHIGNFVEVKKASIEPGAKVNHLSYIGDARVGEGSNVGAGTITCNYDGFLKHFTDIGRNVFIGSNTALVAPVRIGDGAMVGAGSTIARDVPEDSMALTRAEQTQVDGFAPRYRSKKAKQKADQAKAATAKKKTRSKARRA